MSALQHILWRDPFDPKIIHLGYQSGSYITHVAPIHVDCITDMFGREAFEEINNFDEGYLVKIKLTLTIEED